MSENIGPLKLLEFVMEKSPPWWMVPVFITACAMGFSLILVTLVGLSNVSAQLKRQADAAEQSLKLLQEPGVMSKDLGELVKVLKEFQAMAAAEAASSPKK